MHKISHYDDVKNIENLIRSTRCYTVVPKTNIGLVKHFLDIDSFDQIAVKSLILEVYPNRKAIQIIDDGQFMKLAGLTFFRIKFLYDIRMVPERGEIKIPDNAIRVLSSNVWECNENHSKYEIFSEIDPPPCRVCNNNMILKKKALIPSLYDVISNLPDWNTIPEKYKVQSTKKIRSG